MFERILLPVDLTEKSDAALAAAVELLGDSGTAILLHVIETIADAPFEELQDFYQRLEGKAGSALSEMAAKLASAGIAVDQQIIYGRRAAAIVSFARDRGVDLILLSSRPLDPDDPGTAWGSISHQVSILADCPVLLLKQPRTEGR